MGILDAPAYGRVQADARFVNRSHTIVLFGNSRLERELTSGHAGWSSDQGFFGIANAKIGGRFKVLNYAGISGDTFTGMIARHATDVAAYSPQWVLVADPVNDASNNRTSAQMIADAKTIIALNRAIGARTILLTAPPNGAHTSGQRAALNAFNNWVKWANTDGWAVPIDVATCVTNPSTGQWQSPFSSDDLHQNRAGAAHLGRFLAPALAALVPPRDPFPANPLNDATQQIPNSWLNGTPGAGTISGYTLTGTGTATIVARTDGVNGNWQQIDTSAAAASTSLAGTQAAVTIGTAGTLVRFIVEVQTDAWTSLTTMNLAVQWRNASSGAIDNISAFNNDNGTALQAADQYALGETWVFQSPPVAIPANTAYYKVIHSWNAQGKIRIGRQALMLA